MGLELSEIDENGKPVLEKVTKKVKGKEVEIT
ncbi:unnamed protein product, partial [marine sediment metagenome]